MKKKIASYLLAASMLVPATFGLAGCGGDEGDGEHTHSWGSWETTTPATCTTDGKKTRKCSGCDEKEEAKIDKTGHSYNQGECDICGEDDPNWDDSLIDGRVLQNVSLSNAGVLSWTGLRVACKYQLTLKDISGTDHVYNISKETRSIDLTALTDSYKLGFGKNSAKLVAFESLEVEIDGETYEQEAPISTAIETFDIVNINAGYSINRKVYTDEFTTIHDFYSTVYTDAEHGEYLLYEQQTTGTSALKFPLYSKFAPADSNYAVSIYDSDYAKESGTVFNEGPYNSNVIRLEGGESQWVYVDIEDVFGTVIKSYTVLLYCARPLNVEVYMSTRSTPDSNGDIIVSEESYTNRLATTTVWENDILDINMIYDSIPAGMLLRDKNYNIFEKNTDYNTKDMILSGTNLYLFFSAEDEVREHHAEVEAYSEYFDLNYATTGYPDQPPYWSIKYKNNHNNETIVLPSRIIGYSTAVSTSTFYETGIKYLVFESGTTSIPARALYTCDNLISVSIPSTVTFMGEFMLSPNLISPNIYLEGYESSMNGSDTMWNRIGGTMDMYSYYQGQTNCCSMVTKNNVKIKVDNSNNTAAVVGITGANITIPEKVKFGIKEYTVTQIDSLQGANITTVTVSKTIKNFSTNSIPTTLTEIIVAGDNEDYASFEGLLYNKSLSEVLYIPRGITSLTLSENITNITGTIYQNLTSLVEVNIHEGITSIDSPAFKGCSSLSEYVVSANNTNYSAVNGHLYNKAGNELIRFAVGSDNVANITTDTTKIHLGAFVGYTKSSIVLPFIGESATTNKFIGYIFGGTSYSYNNLLPSTLTTIEITNESNIANHAFHQCTNLVSITIKGTATEIGERAFYKCSNLTTVVFDTNVTLIKTDAFNQCAKLENLTLDTSITNIESKAFRSCYVLNYDLSQLTNLTTIGTEAFAYSLPVDLIVPKKLVNFAQGFSNSYIKSVTFQDGGETTIIPDRAFYNCESLTTLTMKSYIKTVDYWAFSGAGLKSYTLHDGLETIGDSAFYTMKNTTMTELVVPNSITSIGSGAFKGLNSLQTLTVPFVGSSPTVAGRLYEYFTETNTLKTLTITNATSIANYAFDEWALETVTLNEGITLIGSYAFYQDAYLTGITIPSTVKSINEYAFSHCPALTNVTFAANSQLESIGKYAFGSETASYNRNLQTFSLPSSVKTIGENAFRGTSLTTINIPNDSLLESIGDYAFLSTQLTGFTITNKLKSIGVGAFKNLSTLETITMSQSPDTSKLETIGNSAFSGCTKMTGFVLSNTLTSIGDSAFYNCQAYSGINGTLTIPRSVTRIEDHTFYNAGLKRVLFHDDITYIGQSAFEAVGTAGINIQFKNVDNTSLGNYKAFILPKKLEHLGRLALAAETDMVVRFTEDNMSTLISVGKEVFKTSSQTIRAITLLFDTAPTSTPTNWTAQWNSGCKMCSKVNSLTQCTANSKTWCYNGCLYIENMSQPQFSNN